MVWYGMVIDVFFVNLRIHPSKEDYSQARKYIPDMTIWMTQFGARPLINPYL